MKFIRDTEGDLVNLDRVEHIFIVDRGYEYKGRYHVTAATQAHEYSLRIFKTKDEANCFLESIETMCNCGR